jgi:hypothetical protein
VYGVLSEGYRVERWIAAFLGVVVGAWVFVLVWWGMSVVRQRQDRWVTRTADRLATDYPRLVEAWGGRHVLDSTETLDAVTRLLDPTAGAKPAGFLGRLFGG